MTKTQIKPEVLNVLVASTVTGNQLTLPGQLDRKLYLAVNEVLEALGAKWNRKAKAHVFELDAAETVEAVVLTGTFARPQDFGFFETPEALAQQLVQRADIQREHRVLEPSAGKGRIARAILTAQTGRSISKIGPARLDCIELQPQLVEHLRRDLLPRFRETEVLIYERDFLAVTPPSPDFAYDRIVMNPPFSKQADIAHVTHALQFLKPGGRLVSVVAAGVLFREDRKTVAFRHLILDGLGGRITGLPEGSFTSSGTEVNTAVVVIDH